jgi:hypothetical protein
MRLVSIFALLAALAGCAPDDIRLSPEQVAQRGAEVRLSETVTRRVFEVGDGRPYYATCLEGWALRDGDVRVTSVAGRRFGPRDFVVTAAQDPGTKGMVARVRHAYPIEPEAGVHRGTYVTLEFRMTCVDPHAR